MKIKIWNNKKTSREEKKDKMKNSGKKFEEWYKRSVPSDAWYYRFKDGTANWSGGENYNVRFQASNIADNLVFYKGHLFLNELKSHHGKSIPLDCIEGNKSKEKQIMELLEAQMFTNVHSNIVVFFSDLEKCYVLNIVQYIEFKRKNDRKSIPLEYFEECGIEIPCISVRTTYKFNIGSYLKKFEN